MANIRVKAKLEKIARELDAVGKHIVQYSGIERKDARSIDNEAAAICEMAARIAAMAREIEGDRSAGTLVRHVRKALGFTYP